MIKYRSFYRKTNQIRGRSSPLLCILVMWIFQILIEEGDDPALVSRKGISVPVGFQTNVAVSVMVVGQI